MSEILQEVAIMLKAWANECEIERGDGSALPKGAGFPASNISRAMYWQRVLANTTYFRHYPNPTHNPIIEQLCTKLDTVSRTGNFLRNMNLLEHFSSGKTFLPRSKRNVDAYHAKPLVEIIEEQLETLLADTSLTQQQRDEAAKIAAAMEDELLFYDQLREQAKQQARAGDNNFMLRAFRKLIPIWVAKQDCCKTWRLFAGDHNPDVRPIVLDARFAPNLFGSRFFDMERWWVLPKRLWGEDDEKAFAEEPIITLIGYIADKDEHVEDELGERFKTRMAANLARYVALVEASAQPDGPFIPSCTIHDPRNGSAIEARDLFAELSVPDLYERFNTSLFPEAVKRKANLVFGAYLAPVVGIANCDELPFTFDGENGRGRGTIEATGCTPRSADNDVDLGVGARPVTIAVCHELTNVPFATSKTIEFPATEIDAAGNKLLCIVGRCYDSTKWDALRCALSNVARTYFGADANGTSYAKRFIDQKMSSFFNSREERWVPQIKQLVYEECFPTNNGASLDITYLRRGFQQAINRFCKDAEINAAPDDMPSKTMLSKRLFKGSSSLVAKLEAQELTCLQDLAKRPGWSADKQRLSQIGISLDKLNSHLLEEVRDCVTKSMPQAFGETGKNLYTPIIMDFLACGVLKWATAKSEERTLTLLESCLLNAFDCFTGFEKNITLECWPNNAAIDEEEAKHLSAISSRHLAFFLDQSSSYRFSMTCLDATNGAIVYAASQNGAQLCLLSQADPCAMNGLLERASTFEKKPPEEFTRACDMVVALSLDDTIDIPVYEGVTVQIVG